jgi:PAS domain S-box-containing protein
LFYDRHPGEQTGVLVPFIAKALESDEQFIYIADDQTVQELALRLEEGGLAVEQARASGRLKLWTHHEWREPGAIDMPNKARQLRGILDQAFSDGFKGVSFAVEMTWALGPDISARQIRRWEMMLNTIFRPGFPGRMICLYSRSRLPDDVLIEALHAHPLAAAGQRVCSDSFCRAPSTPREETEEDPLNGSGAGAPARPARMLLELAKGDAPHLQPGQHGSPAAVVAEDKDARRFMERALEEAGDAFMIVDADWTVMFANEAAGRLADKSQPAMVGASYWDHFPDMRSTVLERMQRLAANERRPALIDYQHRASRCFFEIVVSPAGDRTTLYFRNVTKSRRSHEWLRTARQNLETQVADFKKLHELSSWMLTARDLSSMVEGVLDAALAMQGARMGLLLLCTADGTRLEVAAGRGFPQQFLETTRFIARGEGACGTCYSTGERVVIEDVEADPLFEGCRETARRAGFRAVHSTPLITRGGEIIGVLSAHFSACRRPSGRETDFLDLYARSAADAIEAVHVREQAQREVADRRRAEKRLALQCLITRQLADAGSLLEGCVQVLEAICEEDGWNLGAVWLADGAAEELRCLELWCSPAHPLPEFTAITRELTLKKGAGVPGIIWARGEPVFFPEITPSLNLPRFTAAAGEGLRSCFGFPVRLGREIIGAVEFFSCEMRPPGEDFLRMIDAVSLQIGQFVERKRAEFVRHLTNERLRTSEERFRLATSHSDITLYEQDLELRYTWLFPDTPEYGAALGRTDFELVPNEDGRHLMALKLEVLKSGLNQRCEVKVERAGTVSFFDLFIAPRKNARGEIVGVAGAALDVTSRMQAENASLRLAAIIESSEDAIISKGLDGTIKTWNKGAERLFGYAADEIIGHSILTLIPEERRHEEPEIVARMRRGDRIDHIDTIRRCKDGRLVSVSLSISPLRDRTGMVVGASKIARDITKRRREEQQQQALYELAASVNRAEALPEIYNAALDAICSCQQADRASILLSDEKGVMRFKISRGLSEAYKRSVEGHSPWSASDVLPKPLWIDNVRASALPDALRRTIINEGISALAFIPLTYEKRLIGKFMLYYDSPHVFTAEELRPVEAIATQVAFAIERQKCADALEALVAERTASLRQAIAQMEEFSYSVSHDLRAPLRAMQGYATVLMEDYADRLDADGREYLHKIVRNSTRMDNLIHDTLTYTRMNNTEIRLQPVNLDRLFREIIHQYPEMQPPRASVTMPEPLPPVLGHEPLLSQAISNLLSNAVKFVDAGVTPEVTVQAMAVGDMVRVTIDDNGIGIRPEHQHRIFGMFERVHPAKKYEGTGIGLAIVRKAVERMGGTVGFESDGIRGCRFWMQLPAASSP